MSGRSVRIAIVGAGSAVFSLELIGNLCLTPGLAGSHVVLMDVDAERLDSVHRLATRLAGEQGADLTFERTLDREVALRDAEFVVNTAYATGHERAVRMRETTERHGYHYGNAGLYGPVDLWTLLDLRFRLEFARDMERLCPDAWLLQSGNPVFEGCTLMTRQTSIKVIGICHGYQDYRVVGRFLGLDPDRVEWRASGLNHQLWLTKLAQDGVDAYPILDDWIATRAEDHWRTYRQREPHDIVMSRGAINLYRLYGLMPIGDTARDPINWWLHTDFEAKKHWFGEPWGGPDTTSGRQAFVAMLAERVRRIMAVVDDPTTSAKSLLTEVPLKETHVAIIDAIANDRPGTFQVNVPNRGAIPGIADDVVVDLTAHIDGRGVRPQAVPPLPRKLMLEQTLPRILQMEQQLESFGSGDRSMLLWAALMDHQTRTYGQAVEVLEDLLELTPLAPVGQGAPATRTSTAVDPEADRGDIVTST
ncbi:MAG: alpha-glucosidase/alpha-galactosidase [Chloroflexota bacterium]